MKFEKATVEIVAITVEDIITTSGFETEEIPA